MILEGLVLVGAFYGVKKAQDIIIKSDFLPSPPVVKMPSVSEIAESRKTIERNLKMLDAIDVEYWEVSDEPPPSPSTPTPNFTRETVKEWVKAKIDEGKLTINEMTIGEQVFNPEKVISIKDLMIFTDTNISEGEWVILLDYMVDNSNGGMIRVDGLNYKVAPSVVEQVAKNIADPTRIVETTAELWKKFGEDTDKVIFASLELGKVMGTEAMSVDHIRVVSDAITIDEVSRQAILPIDNIEYHVGEIPKGVVMYVAERMEMKSVGWVDRTRSPMIFFFNPTQTEEAVTHKPKKKEKGPNPKRVEIPGRGKPKQQNQQQPQVRTKG